jgi:hypothetical protein
MKLKFLNAERRAARSQRGRRGRCRPGIKRSARSGLSACRRCSRASSPTDAAKYGTAFEQFCAHSGLFVRSDRGAGIRVPSMHDVLTARR